MRILLLPLAILLALSGLATAAPVTYNSSDVPYDINNLTPTVYSTLSITDSFVLTKLTVTVNITHTWVGDLILTLIAPDATPVLLVARRGSAGDNFQNTVFDDDSPVYITDGAPPFAGSYHPEQSLNILNGKSVQGVWTLFVEDASDGDVGQLLNWSLTATPASASAVPEPGTVALLGAALLALGGAARFRNGGRRRSALPSTLS